jgi:hypothetical protein
MTAPFFEGVEKDDDEGENCSRSKSLMNEPSFLG